MKTNQSPMGVPQVLSNHGALFSCAQTPSTDSAFSVRYNISKDFYFSSLLTKLLLSRSWIVCRVMGMNPTRKTTSPARDNPLLTKQTKLSRNKQNPLLVNSLGWMSKQG